MPGTGRRARTVAVVAVAAIVLSACQGGGLDRSGGRTTRTLVLANRDGSLVGAPAVARFVQQVSERSHGALAVQVRSTWAGGRREADVIEDVAAGQADLGWSGTRAFDVVGVGDFQALHAPLLVSTYPAQAAVVREGLTPSQRSGLSALGLSALALAGDEIRRPAAASGPLLDPGDYRELRVATLASEAQSAGLAALGAVPVTVEGSRPPHTDGVDAIETMWWTYRVNDQAAFVPFVTGNVGLWPRTLVIFANSSRLAGLTAGERRVVEEAARDAATWSVTHAGENEATEVVTACSRGARIATASPDQLAALRRAAEPAYDRLRADPARAADLRRVEALVARAAATADRQVAVPDSCRYEPGGEARMPAVVPVLDGPGRPGGLPAGTYRFVVTEPELRAHGYDEEFGRANAGVWTWVLGGGRWRFVLQQSSDNPPDWGGNVCAGYYDVTGSTIRFSRVTTYERGDCAPATWLGEWRPDGRDLRWDRMVMDGHDLDYLFGGKVWQRIS